MPIGHPRRPSPHRPRTRSTRPVRRSASPPPEPMPRTARCQTAHSRGRSTCTTTPTNTRNASHHRRDLWFPHDPPEGHTESTVFYRVNLTVKDSAGRTDDLCRRSAAQGRLRLASTPSGLEPTLDGQPQSTPYAEEDVVGVKRDLGPVSPETMGGKTYEFVSWSDGSNPDHAITTPTTNTTYTATFREITSTTPTSLQLKPTTRTPTATPPPKRPTPAHQPPSARAERPRRRPLPTLRVPRHPRAALDRATLATAPPICPQPEATAPDSDPGRRQLDRDHSHLEQPPPSTIPSEPCPPERCPTTSTRRTSAPRTEHQLGTTTTIAISGTAITTPGSGPATTPTPSYQPRLTLTFTGSPRASIVTQPSSRRSRSANRATFEVCTSGASAWSTMAAGRGEHLQARAPTPSPSTTAADDGRSASASS